MATFSNLTERISTEISKATLSEVIRTARKGIGISKAFLFKSKSSKETCRMSKSHHHSD